MSHLGRSPPLMSRSRSRGLQRYKAAKKQRRYVAVKTRYGREVSTLWPGTIWPHFMCAVAPLGSHYGKKHPGTFHEVR